MEQFSSEPLLSVLRRWPRRCTRLEQDMAPCGQVFKSVQVFLCLFKCLQVFFQLFSRLFKYAQSCFSVHVLSSVFKHVQAARVRLCGDLKYLTYLSVVMASPRPTEETEEGAIGRPSFKQVND